MGTEFEVTRRRKGPRGLAEVRVLKNVTKISFPELKKVVEIPNEDVNVPVVSDDSLMVELSSGENAVYRCHPYSGTHFVRVHSFVRIGGEPEPKTFTVAAHHVKAPDGSEWDEPDREKFSVNLEIVGESKYKGMLVPFTLDYLVDRKEDGTVKFVGPKKRLARLRDFLLMAGYDPANDTILYEENILPALEDLLLSRNTVFLALLENGWVQSVSPAPLGSLPRPKKASSASKPRAKKS